MNRKFFLNGQIVSRLMHLQEVSPTDLANSLNITPQAISQIIKRDFIKDTDAVKILAAFKLSFEEAEKMDSEGVFTKKNIPNNSIDSSENQQFKDFSAKIESLYDKLNEQYSIELNRLRNELAQKDLLIQAKNKIIVALVESMTKNNS